MKLNIKKIQPQIERKDKHKANIRISVGKEYKIISSKDIRILDINRYYELSRDLSAKAHLVILGIMATAIKPNAETFKIKKLAFAKDNNISYRALNKALDELIKVKLISFDETDGGTSNFTYDTTLFGTGDIIALNEKLDRVNVLHRDTMLLEEKTKKTK